MDIKARYHIQSDGTISNEGEGDYISLRMTDGNTLMVDYLSVTGLSMEHVLKGILTAQTEFISGFVIPAFSSELETKDGTGVIERFSNMPGRSVERQSANTIENNRTIGLKGKVLGDAAGVASKAANTAAEAASEAATNAISNAS